MTEEASLSTSALSEHRRCGAFSSVPSSTARSSAETPTGSGTTASRCITITSMPLLPSNGNLPHAQVELDLVDEHQAAAVLAEGLGRDGAHHRLEGEGACAGRDPAAREEAAQGRLDLAGDVLRKRGRRGRLISSFVTRTSSSSAPFTVSAPTTPSSLASRAALRRFTSSPGGTCCIPSMILDANSSTRTVLSSLLLGFVMATPR